MGGQAEAVQVEHAQAQNMHNIKVSFATVSLLPASKAAYCLVVIAVCLAAQSVGAAMLMTSTV